jgi:lipid-binding SYLF domain-containing protein
MTPDGAGGEPVAQCRQAQPEATMSPTSDMRAWRTDATRRWVAGGLVAAGALVAAGPSFAARASQITTEARAALDQLYAQRPETRNIGARAKSVLVFPSIVKAGLVVGGQSGEGAMLTKGQPTAFYRLSAASYGLQAGAQKYAYAMFFMTDSALDYLKKSGGWAVGSGPSFVVLDEGAAKSTNTTTMKKDVWVIAFGQKGLMGGLGMEGTKITQIHPDP